MLYSANCYFYVTDGWSVYPGFIPDGDQIVSKTYMTRVEEESEVTSLISRTKDQANLLLLKPSVFSKVEPKQPYLRSR